MSRRTVWLLLTVVLAAAHFTATLNSGQTRSNDWRATTPAPKRSSSAIAITSDGGLLLVVNPDSNSISLIAPSPAPNLQEISVGIDPRTVALDDEGRRAYVANRGSHTVSVVNLDSQQVIADVPVGARPYGVVVSPDGSRLYVAEQGADRINIIATDSLSTLETIPTLDRPSGLALRSDGGTLYVTHLFLNGISVMRLPHGRLFLPLIGNAESTGRQPEPASARPAVASSDSPHFITLFPSSNLVQSIVLSPDGETAYVPHTRSNSTNRTLTLDSTVFPTVSLIDLDSGQHLVGDQIELFTIDPPAVGLPFDAAVTADGRELWVANAASNDVTVIDLDTRQRAAHIEVGDNPRGIVIAPDGSTAYVNNALAGTVSVIDTATYSVTSVMTSTLIPLEPTLLLGKRLFNSSDDPRMGKDQWMSCNTCHFDGENDGQTWFLGFAGPRNTSSLLGMGETFPLRWSGEWDEAADSEFAIRMDSFGDGLIDGEMNCSLDPPDCVNHPPNGGRSAELDALAAYISSLELPLSPNHIHGQPLTEAEQRGQALFNSPETGCADCHPSPLYTDNLIHDVGTATAGEKIGPTFNTPSLRGVYDSAPYFHDGSASTLYEAVTRPTAGGEHDVSGILAEEQMQDLIAYLLALPFEDSIDEP